MSESPVTSIASARKRSFIPCNDMHDDIIIVCKGHYPLAGAPVLGSDVSRLRTLLIILGPHLAITQVSREDLILLLLRTIETELPHVQEELTTAKSVLRMIEGYESAVFLLISIIANSRCVTKEGVQLYEAPMPDERMTAFIRARNNLVDPINIDPPRLVLNGLNEHIGYKIG